MRAGAGGNHSEVGALKRVLVKRPEQAFISQSKLDAEWKQLGYRECPDFRKAAREHDAFVSILSEHAEIATCPEDPSVTMPSTGTFSPGRTRKEIPLSTGSPGLRAQPNPASSTKPPQASTRVRGPMTRVSQTFTAL